MGCSVHAARFAAWVHERHGRQGFCAERQADLAALWQVSLDTVRRYERELRRIGAWSSEEIPGTHRRLILFRRLNSSGELGTVGDAASVDLLRLGGREVRIDAANGAADHAPPPQPAPSNRARVHASRPVNRAPVHASEPCTGARLSTSLAIGLNHQPGRSLAPNVRGGGASRVAGCATWPEWARQVTPEALRPGDPAAAADVLAWAKRFGSAEAPRALAAAVAYVQRARCASGAGFLVHGVRSGAADAWVAQANQAAGAHQQPVLHPWDQDLERLVIELRCGSDVRRAAALPQAWTRFGGEVEAIEALAQHVESLPEGAQVACVHGGGLAGWRGRIKAYRERQCAIAG